MSTALLEEPHVLKTIKCYLCRPKGWKSLDAQDRHDYIMKTVHIRGSFQKFSQDEAAHDQVMSRLVWLALPRLEAHYQAKDAEAAATDATNLAAALTAAGFVCSANTLTPPVSKLAADVRTLLDKVSGLEQAMNDKAEAMMMKIAQLESDLHKANLGTAGFSSEAVEDGPKVVEGSAEQGANEGQVLVKEETVKEENPLKKRKLEDQ